MNTFYTLPARNDLPWYKFKVSLSGSIYTLRFRFNVRMQRWILDIADNADNDLLSGLPLITMRNINGQYVIEGLPNGMLFISDDTDKGEQPTRNSFGKDKTLWFEDQST